MKLKPDLVLDIAGVLVTNFSPSFWQYLSTTYDVQYEELLKFKKGVREELWTGKITEQAFWTSLQRLVPNLHSEAAKEQLLSMITPLPAVEEIPGWSEIANIHLLSNHRLEWIYCFGMRSKELPLGTNLEKGYWKGSAQVHGSDTYWNQWPC